MMNFARRYEPYQRNADCQQECKSPRKVRKKQSLVMKRIETGKTCHEKCSKKPLSPSSHESRLGDYILSETDKPNRLCKAIHIHTGEEYACLSVEKSKYIDTVTPYFMVNAHENINEIVDIISSKQYVYLVFERSYGDLHSYIRSKRRLKEDEACKLFKQIAEAVHHCHNNGVVIRDLKLRKFVFKDSGRTQLKLQMLDSVYIVNKNTGDVLYDKHGCPAYVSPEILESVNGYSSKAADMWSLGVIIFTMLSGRYPFHEQEPSALFAKIKSGLYTIPDFISAPGKCLIQSILRKIPEERLTAEELLEHPWFSSDFEKLLIPAYSRCDRKKYDQLVPDVNTKNVFRSALTLQ